MLKKSYKALVSCSYALSYGLLSGALLCSSALAQSSEQDLAPSVSEAAVHALSQNAERSAQGKLSPSVSAIGDDEEVSQDQSLLDAVQGTPSSTQDSYTPDVTSTQANEEGSSSNSDTLQSPVASTNDAPSQTIGSMVDSSVHNAQVSDSPENNAQVSNLQVSDSQDSSVGDSSAVTANSQSIEAGNVESAAPAFGSKLDTIADGHPLESAGQNKFGAFRSSQGQSKGPLTEGLQTPGGIMQWMLSTVGVLLLIFVLAYVFRKSKFIQKSVGSMQIEGQLALGQKERLLRVRVGDRSLLLGVTPNSVNLVMDLGTSEVKGTQETPDNHDLHESTEDSVSTPYSASYKSAQEAYSRKHYEDILVSLSQVAASAAASAAMNAVRGSFGAGEQRFGDESPAQAFAPAQAPAPASASFNASQEGSDQCKVQADMDTAEQRSEGEMPSVRPKPENAPRYVKEPFQAIVEPHANEAHHIANHFSSEHTIVRASNATPFMGAQFGLPPDNEVLHARAQRSKQYAQELENEYRPRLSEDELAQGEGGQGKFGQYLDSAMTDLRNRRGSSTMVDTKPWVAEDDLAQELERNDHTRR